jgi:hypothetical protein
MRFLIIGQSVIDEIDSKEGFFIKPGGVFYSATGLLQISESKDEIFLLTNISQIEYEYFKSTYNNLDLKYSTFVNELPHVKLKIWENKERDETYTNIAQTLTFPKTLGFFDGILLNMISGFDLTIEELSQIRKNYNGLIYFDIHSLARGIGENNNRYFRQIKNIKLWFDNVDIVQCNENELLTICNYKDEKDIAEFVLSFRPKILIVTKGEFGATLYTKLGTDLIRENVLPIKVIPKNKVGCGDVFGATFFYFYIKTGNIKIALDYANTAAGLITQYVKIEDFYKLNIELKKYYD